MIAVAIADPALLQGAKENGERLAKLADPRTIGLDDSKAQPLIDQTYPVYYITGTIHSSETGAPTALMELAYRLAVDDAPYIKYIRSHMIVLITPAFSIERPWSIFTAGTRRTRGRTGRDSPTGAITLRTITIATRWA